MVKKTVKYLLISVVALFIIANAIIIFSGRWYLYKAIGTTYLQGRKGPSATEYSIFENRVIKANNPKPWPVSKNHNNAILPQNVESVMKMANAHAFIIIKRDTIIHEQYWDNFSDTSHTNSFSMAKSYTSALLGFAIKDGFIKNIHEPVSTYIPEFKNDWRAKITLEHLVSMSSGIAFNESYADPFSYPAEGYYGTDLLKASTKYKKQASEPGAVHNYLSGNTALLGYCISKATGKPLSTYLSEKLWTPLNCEYDAHWSLDAKDRLEKSFCCINSNATDFARMGKLYMNFGNWEGKQLLDSSFIKSSITPFQSKNADGTPNTEYGYSWWLMNYQGMPVYYMQGILGQYVICVPDKKLVICRLARSPVAKNEYSIDVPFLIDAALIMYPDK